MAPSRDADRLETMTKLCLRVSGHLAAVFFFLFIILLLFYFFIFV